MQLSFGSLIIGKPYIEFLETVRGRIIKIIQRLRSLAYKERLKRRNLHSLGLERMRAREDMTEVRQVQGEWEYRGLNSHLPFNTLKVPFSEHMFDFDDLKSANQISLN